MSLWGLLGPASLRGYADMTGYDALTYLAEDGGSPPQDRLGLVILDLSVPEMEGHETIARLRRVHPDLPAVLASGYAQSEVMLRFEGARGVSFIEKPTPSRG